MYGAHSLHAQCMACSTAILVSAEILLGIMKQHGYSRTYSPEAANVVLLNTCSIREKAEQKVRLSHAALPLPFCSHQCMGGGGGGGGNTEVVKGESTPSAVN